MLQRQNSLIGTNRGTFFLVSCGAMITAIHFFLTLLPDKNHMGSLLPNDNSTLTTDF